MQAPGRACRRGGRGTQHASEQHVPSVGISHLQQHIVNDCAYEGSNGHQKAHPAAHRVQPARRALRGAEAGGAGRRRDALRRLRRVPG